MRRDMDLVRQILIEISEGKFQLKHYGEDDIDGIKKNHLLAYHLKIMAQAELIEVEVKLDYTNNYMLTRPPVLTWEGNEFLDSILNENVWTRIKENIKDKGGAIPFDVLKLLATKYCEQLFL